MAGADVNGVAVGGRVVKHGGSLSLAIAIARKKKTLLLPSSSSSSSASSSAAFSPLKIVGFQVSGSGKVVGLLGCAVFFLWGERVWRG